MKPYNERIGGYRPGKMRHEAPPRRIGRLAAKPLPPKVDLREFLTDVEEQVGNSCVANAFAGAYEYLAKRSLGTAGDVSRLFIYYNARAAQGEEEEDSGSMMDSAIESLKTYGACNEAYWPNHEDSITARPSEDAYGDAANFIVTEAEYVATDLSTWKQTLAEGSPIAFALNTFDSFDEATDNKGRVPLPKSSDHVRTTHGWHAMLCVGYLDKDEMFIVRNSWGPTWGDQGYCYIPYKYVMNEDFNGHDSWTIKGLSDLDFSAEVGSDADESYFSEEGSIQLFHFYVRTDDVEGFAAALEELCKNWTEDEEDYYFDYEEKTESRHTYAEIKNFDIAIDDVEKFTEELDELCADWAEAGDYDFNVEGHDEEETDEEEESEGEDEEETDETEDAETEDEDEEVEEETEAVSVAFSEFYIYTEKSESVVAKVDKLCAKYALNGNDYSFEYEEDEDDDGVFVSFSDFIVNTEDGGGFLEALEALCEKVADDGGYNWTDAE